MKTLIKIAWRNVWRNKARSIVIILAIGFGLWGGIFATSFMNGMINQMFDSGIKNQVSHIQIHHPEFAKERLTEYKVEKTDRIYEQLSGSSRVVSWSGRTLVSGMVNTARMSSAIEIFGIDPDMESNTTDLENSLIAGDYFISVTDHPVLIGTSLSEKMKLEIDDRIVITFQDLGGDITAASFRICGIYRTSNSVIDERNIYVKQKDISELLGSDNIINEIAILLDDHEVADEYRDELTSLFPGYEIRTWNEISPELSFMTEFSGIAMMVLVIIILFAMAFGLLNTMLMTIFERTRELGVLMSVGMNKGRVFLMIMLETCFLVFSGALLGSVLGAFSVAATGRNGVDLSSVGGDAMTAYGMDPLVFPVIENIFYLHLAILVLITAIAASVYPAMKALKLKPAEAVRKE